MNKFSKIKQSKIRGDRFSIMPISYKDIRYVVAVTSEKDNLLEWEVEYEQGGPVSSELEKEVMEYVKIHWARLTLD
jgi:hypothetical protein